MQAIIDVIGALAIGGLVLITMLTTLFNVQFTSHDIARSVLLYDNVQKTCEMMHGVLAIVAIDMPVDSVFITMSTDEFSFYSKWNILADQLDSSTHIYRIYQDTTLTEFGAELILTQDGNDTQLLSHLLWVRDLEFVYLDAADAETNNLSLIRTVRADIEFRRTSTNMDRNDLNTNISLWNSFKNISIK